MEEAQENVNHAAEVARQATHFDASGSHQAAIYMYRQAAEYLQRAMTLGLSTPALQDHAMKYKERADQLENLGMGFVWLMFFFSLDLTFEYWGTYPGMESRVFVCKKSKNIF